MNDRNKKNEQAEASHETSNGNYIGLPPEKAFYLQRIEVLQGLQNDLLNWGKRRFWFISVIVSIIALLGGATLLTSLIEVRVNSKITKEFLQYEKKLEELRDTTSLAKAATADAEKSAEESRTKLKIFENETKNFANEIKKLESRSSSLRNELADSSKDSLRISEELRIEVSRIAELVGKLSSKNEVLLTQAKSVQKSLTESKTSIEKASELADLIRYEVLINSFEKGDLVEKELRLLGINAKYDEKGPAKEKPEKFKGISIGKSAPIDVISSVIAIVNTLLPEIEYAYIDESNIFSNEITIGMSTEETAHQYRPLDKNDFIHIKSLKSIQELHTFLAKFKITSKQSKKN